MTNLQKLHLIFQKIITIKTAIGILVYIAAIVPTITRNRIQIVNGENLVFNSDLKNSLKKLKDFYLY